ncbi:serine/threonine-protein kinase VRK1-like isoform X1 [Biomphalaria glabrata]|uniref:non-specific serine/threonine protein kinase n=2 Tax=Biomphalaria glabrata TaxID=6526 RepID=A0A9U8E1X5_BIOGL|nr:serine/threonine-protein kinase VRK1-like isoform X1 [Biomphalaria glabrata]XP_013069457.2 serine/threonine-protein kinase VRK1-like isoform X1 [Biomphalaria glabrata]
MPRTAASGGKKIPSSHKLPEQFPPGTVMQDVCKQEWCLGAVVGKGGFGLIYLASRKGGAGTKSEATDFVIKIEPKENGPLFCEMQFYQRVAKKECIETFITKNKLKYLGIPPYIGTGNITFKSKEYRFLVMDRFETDLQKLLLDKGGTFPPSVVYAVGLRMIDALQFCHENEYVHADIKASNILLKNIKDTQQVFLVDFGLAYRYTVNGDHKVYKEDPRQAHNGTIEFTSRDAHKGVAPSPRGDMEILGYCMLQWLCKKLPWEDHLKSAPFVASSKEKFMNDIPNQIKSCLKDSSADILRKYFELVKTLKYDSTPNYASFKKILHEGLSNVGQKDEWKIDFGSPKLIGVDSETSRKRKSEGLEESVAKKSRSPQKSPASPKKTIKSAKSNSRRSPQVKSKSDNSPFAMPADKRSQIKSTKSSPLVKPVAKRSPLVNARNVRSPLVKTDSSLTDTSSSRSLEVKTKAVSKTKTMLNDRKSPVSYLSSPKNRTNSSLTGVVDKSSTYRKLKRVPKRPMKSLCTQTSPQK